MITSAYLLTLLATVPVLTLDAGAPAPVVVAAAGDISGDGMAQESTARLLEVLKPDAVLVLGDNAYGRGSLEQYQRFFAPSWGRLKPLIRPVPGNHDHATAGLAGYCGYFGAAAHCQNGFSYYSYDLGGWHVIALDSGCSAPALCSAVMSPRSEMVAWLAKDLAANQKKCTLAYWHHPRYSSGPHGNDVRSTAVWKMLYDAGADVVLTGHDHIYERFQPMDAGGKLDVAKGLTEFVVGTGGGAFYNFAGAIQSTSLVRENKSHGVLKLSLYPDHYDYEFVASEWTSFADKGTASCH